MAAARAAAAVACFWVSTCGRRGGRARTAPAVPLAREVEELGVARLDSTVWQSASAGRQLPSPVAVASEETRKTAVLWSSSTPRKTKKGVSTDGSGVRRARSRSCARLPAWPKRSVRRKVSRLSGLVVAVGGRRRRGPAPAWCRRRSWASSRRAPLEPPLPGEPCRAARRARGGRRWRRSSWSWAARTGRGPCRRASRRRSAAGRRRRRRPRARGGAAPRASAAAVTAGSATTRRAEHDGHGDERGDERQRHGPQPLLDEVAPDVLEERHHFAPVAVAVGGVAPRRGGRGGGPGVAVPAAAGRTASRRRSGPGRRAAGRPSR